MLKINTTQKIELNSNDTVTFNDAKKAEPSETDNKLLLKRLNNRYGKIIHAMLSGLPYENRFNKKSDWVLQVVNTKIETNRLSINK